LQGPDTDERNLVIAAQKDPSRFAELYELHFDRVYTYIARRVHDREATEELTAHVFEQALANLGRFTWRGAPFATWLFRIAANSIADDYQRRNREQGLPAPERVVEPNLEEIEEQAHLFALVRELPDDQRLVIQLRFGEQMSIREVAQELQRSEGAVKQLQFRALQSLRARMSEKHG
jgi:RNA polymerase sigma-70 factor, ECF subfamily